MEITPTLQLLDDKGFPASEKIKLSKFPAPIGSLINFYFTESKVSFGQRNFYCLYVLGQL